MLPHAGKRVKLQGFKGFLGGLDNDRDLTGQESVFTDFHHLEVMFHVAPLMPFTPNDPQQVRTYINGMPIQWTTGLTHQMTGDIIIINTPTEGVVRKEKKIMYMKLSQ